jgi:hypothetical protein
VAYAEDDPKIELLDEIDRLTTSQRSKVMQEAGTATVELPPLLTQLEDAVAGTIGIGGSGSLPNERNVLDSDALEKFLRIKSLIRDWALSVQSVVYPEDPARTLRAWYVKYTAAERELASVRFYTGKAKSWVFQIEAKLDPPRIRELPDRCPDCHAFEWWNPADKHRYLHPLIVEYRPTGADMIQQALARCRACEKTWGVRQLAYEIEQAFLHDWDEAIQNNLEVVQPNS